jgi:hypothetical protein
VTEPQREEEKLGRLQRFRRWLRLPAWEGAEGGWDWDAFSKSFGRMVGGRYEPPGGVPQREWPEQVEPPGGTKPGPPNWTLLAVYLVTLVGAAAVLYVATRIFPAR